MVAFAPCLNFYFFFKMLAPKRGASFSVLDSHYIYMGYIMTTFLSEFLPLKSVSINLVREKFHFCFQGPPNVFLRGVDCRGPPI